MGILDNAIKRQHRLPRFLCHIYQRLRQDRLNLVTGAGISIDANVPSWFGLLDRLAEASPELKRDLDDHRKSGLNPEYLGQILFHRFENTVVKGGGADLRDAKVAHGWASSIHDAIYKDVNLDINNITDKHPYLSQICNLARKLSLVINFNFDDILAEAIGEQVKRGVPGRSFNVTWSPPLTDRRDNTTIYHVNGILPRVSLKKRSPQLIFTEDSFADAAARSPGVSAEYVFLRFVQNTMLIVGHSLADNSLKNYLRRNRDRSPANHHYMIYYLRDEDSLSERGIRDIFQANIELYNVITIFLTSGEIQEFLLTLNLNDRDFCDRLDSMGGDKRSKYHYYIVGPVAAGKSTLLEHLRCFNTHEEWTRPPPREMYLASNKISNSQQAIIDDFIYSELKEKNRRMHSESAGFHFMDRAPLDLYAFSKDEEEKKDKSLKLKQLVVRDKDFQQGEIIFIDAKAETLVRRNIARGRPPEESGEEAYFETQIRSLKEIYNPRFHLSTDDDSAGIIAKKVARHVLLEEYCPVDLGAIVKRYE